MKKISDTIYQTTINSLSHDGRGVAAIDGKTTFISGALPNEAVLFHYTKHHKNFDEAKTTEILTSAPERVTPKCAHFSLCGGCSLQHLAPESQIVAKQKILLEQLQHFGKLTPAKILPPLTGPVWGYRRKARLGVRYVRKKEKILVGFREKINPRFLADIENCKVLHPSVGELITPLKKLITELKTYDQIPQIEVAIGDQVTALIVRHLQTLPEGDLLKLCAFAETHQLHLYLQPKGIDSVHLLWPQQAEELLSYRLDAFDLELYFHPTDFTQVNAEINQAMVARAVELLAPAPTDQVLDLFCGLGNFSLVLAKHCQQVTGIEGDKRMVQRASANAEHNGITNAAFYSANLADSAAFTHAPWARQQFAKIVIDPPRSGALTIIQHLPKLGAGRIVYTSCNPATLARDAGELAKQGFALTAAGVMDMFPHTSHVEAIAVFEK